MSRRPIRNTRGHLAPAHHRPVRLTPGAFASLQQGCTCSPVVNCYGRGQGDQNYPFYMVAPGCVLHDDTPDAPGTRRCERCHGVIAHEGPATIHEACLTASELRYRQRRRKTAARSRVDDASDASDVNDLDDATEGEAA